MSWKYSPSYAANDHSSARDSSQTRFGFSAPRYGLSGAGRQSRWSSSLAGDSKSRNCAEVVEQGPVWARTNASDNPISVQKLKERLNVLEEPRRETRAYKKAETKELSGAGSGRPYGRSLTTLSLGDGSEGGSRFRKRSDRTPDAEKPGYFDKRQISYVPTATTKLLSRKYSNDLSPTTLNGISKSFGKIEKSEEDENTVTVVTRGTSPTPTASGVFLRSKRADYGLEKKVPRFRKRPEMSHKEVQTDREEVSLAKYGNYTDGSGRAKPWSSYGNSYCPKYSGRCSYGTESKKDQLGFRVGDGRKSGSRDESEDPTTPDSPLKSLATKPPASLKSPPASPLKESERKSFVRKSPPASGRAPCAKTELAKTPNSPALLSSPLQCKIVTAETLHNVNGSSGGRSPKVTVDRCPDIPRAIEDVSSTSESSEEETSSDEEPDHSPITVKKSVTNFLQNIPGPLPQSPSRASVHQRPNTLAPQIIPFQRIESGERAWWMESADNVARPVAKQDRDAQDPKPGAGNFLSPPYLINRQFSRDKDWLKESPEGPAKELEKVSPRDDHGPRQSEGNREPFGRAEANGFAHGTRGDCFFKSQNPGNNFPVEVGNFEETLDPLKRIQYGKSPDNFLLEETNQQMKFNQHGADERKYLADFPRECSMKDLSQKLHNGLGSPLEDKNLLEPGDMSGMISKAKACLSKSKTKLDIKKSSSRETSPKVTDTKSEIDLYWKELADSMNRPLRLCDLDFTDLNTDDETDILGNLRTNGEVPPPPPMLVLPVPSAAPPKPFAVPAPPGNAPQQTPRPSRAPAPPPVPQIVKNKKTVKLFWKEVKEEPKMQSKSLGATLIWNELVKVNVDTQKLEHLFESRAKDLMSKKQQEQNKNKEIIVLDPKRSNAINIGMTKLPPPRAIKTAILKMDSTVVNKEGIEKLLAMLPTEEEKLRIQEAQTANPDVPLGSAEQFLLTLASITELEARLRLWAFKLDFENSEKEICEPLMDLKQGMEILRGNRTFRGILSTLLSVGNFLNGCDAKGFQIEYLSKVPEVKDTVHKHSLLHHLCIIVMDKFPDSTDLYSEIGAVTRASKVDFDELAANIKKVEEECKLSWNYLKIIAKHEGHTAVKVKMSDFLADCAERIIILGTVHKRIISRFQKFAFWLGVPTNRISTTRPNEIFKIISEFALEYRTTRDRVLQQIKKMNREKSRSRGYLSHDAGETVTRKMNSKEAKDDARLKQLLANDTACSENGHHASTWRRQRNNTKNLVLETNDDEEILETLIKTANQSPSARAALKERRRSRVYGKYCK